MSNELILYPAFAMFMLTLGCIVYMGRARFRAVKNKELKLSFYSTYDKGSQPEYLVKIGRHIQNHFEVPPLFYIGLIGLYLTQSVSIVSLIAAWLYVVARIIHSIIHLGSNNIFHRFKAYFFSLLCLLIIWASWFYSLINLSAIS